MGVWNPLPGGLVIALLVFKRGETSQSFVSRVRQLCLHPVGQFKRRIRDLRLIEERRQYEIGPNSVPEIRFARKQYASSDPVQFQMYLPSPILHLVATGSNENFIDLVI